MIQNPPDLHKIFVRVSQPKSFNIFRIFDEYERLVTCIRITCYLQHSRPCCIGYTIAFGSNLYIRYNTATHVVNSIYMSFFINITEVRIKANSGKR